jgi:hypothetical protein
MTIFRINAYAKRFFSSYFWYRALWAPRRWRDGWLRPRIWNCMEESHNIECGLLPFGDGFFVSYFIYLYLQRLWYVSTCNTEASSFPSQKTHYIHIQRSVGECYLTQVIVLIFIRNQSAEFQVKSLVQLHMAEGTVDHINDVTLLYTFLWEKQRSSPLSWHNSGS